MSGQPRGQEYSLVLLSQSQRSLLAWLPTAFSRASLWRPSWVGAWTFWVLAGGLLATFALAVLAVLKAAEDDDAVEHQPASDGPTRDNPSSTEPPADDPSEAAQDRPQPVT
jgi:hypothetical protein